MRHHSAYVSRDHDDGLSVYLHQIGQHPLLDAKTEVELGTRVQHGCKNAFEQMVLSNLRLVIHVARQFRNRGVPLADLIEEGNIGLMHAVRGFDPSRGFRFSTYAVWLIRQSMENAVRNLSRTVRIPDRIARQMKQQNSDASGMDNTTESQRMDNVPLDSMLYETHGAWAEDTLPAPRAAEEQAALDEESKHLVSLCLAHLPPRDALVLRHRFGVDGKSVLTLKEIGVQLHVSPERVRQLEQQVLQKLRHFLGSMHLDAADIVSC